jgi:TLC domain
VRPACERLGFEALAEHLHVVLGAALFYQGIFSISPYFSSFFKSYTDLRKRAKINWDIHVVSMIQSIAICYLAYLALGDPKLKADRVHGYSPFGADVSALACGYFIWDSYVSVKYASLFGIGFALHGLASLSVFAFGFVFPERECSLMV